MWLLTSQLVKYASILMYNEPEGTINMLMTIHSSSRVNPRDLIPALMRCDDSKIKGAVHPVMRYLEFVIASKSLFQRHTNRITEGSTDPEIHNFLIGYYARLPDEKKLTTFILQHERKKIYFEPDFALQLCTKYNKRVSEVFIFGLVMFVATSANIFQIDGSLGRSRYPCPQVEFGTRQGSG